MKKIIALGFILTANLTFAKKPCESDPNYNEFDFWIGTWEASGN